MADLILYDGVCALCNRMVRIVLARDREDRFRFAPLQGALARDLLRRHGRDPGALATFYLVSDYQTPAEQVHERGRGAIHVLRALSGSWRLLGRLLGVLPAPLVDLGYRLVARHRYRIFGRYETCPLPPPEQRHKFLHDG